MISRLKTLLAVLQQSHYDTGLLGSWIRRHPKPADWDTFKDKIEVVWTLKAKILFISSITFSYCIPFVLVCNLKLMRPWEWLATKVFSFRARRHLRKTKFRAIIGITGSFGKTTTKEIVAQILGEKFRMHKTPENVNTLLGIAGWINRTDFQDGDILIVEMGAYRKGDIAHAAAMVEPTIGILTGLNEAHRERFGSLEATASAKSELIDALPAGGIGLWNQDSKLLQNAVELRLEHWTKKGIQIIPYSRKGSENIQLSCESAGESGLLVRIGQDTDKTPASQDNNIPTFSRMLECQMPFLGEHFCQELAAAATIGTLLGMSQEEIAKRCESLRPLSRRLAPTLLPGNRLLIDDSYNITLDGVRAALEVLVSINRRKIGVFAGIPEGGKESKKINQELGQIIGKAFDLILLRETPVKDAVCQGLRESKFPEANIVSYTESKEVETILVKVTKDGDCIYFSACDWPVIYL